MKRRILLVEDDVQIAAALREVLESEGYAVFHATRGESGLELAAGKGCDIVLTDLKLPGLNGLELVRRLHTSQPQLPIILMTAHGTTDTAIEATRHGAYDYLLKPFEMPELIAVVEKALASCRLTASPVAVGDPAPERDAIIGRSRAMQTIFKEMGRIAARNVPVLIRGETGTGKELIARAVYQHSDRAGRPFIAVNCAAIPETLLESELFGHEKGAFTGAEARRIGRFEQAHGGTIFLDEIGDMTTLTQVKLLRVLHERAIQRVGGNETIPIDVRVLAATHRDLERAMEEQNFREDLFYRLNGVTLTLPPLRERAEDIPQLVEYFTRRYAAEFGLPELSIAREAMCVFLEQEWPGNIRELENTVRKAVLGARGYGLSAEQVREACNPRRGRASAVRHPFANFVAEQLAAALRGERNDVYTEVVEAAERELLAQAIKLASGNQARAARWLGLSRLTLREKLHHFSLHPTQEAREQTPDA